MKSPVFFDASALIQRALVISSVLTVSVSIANAAISWGSATTISDLSDISTNGTSVQAVNFYGASDYATLNGVFFGFASFTDNTASASFGSNEGLLLIEAGAGAGGLRIDAVGTYGTVSEPYNSLGLNYKKLLDNSVYRDSSDRIMNLTFQNLNIGDRYEVQFWANNSLAAGSGENTILTDGSANAVTLDQNSTDAEGGIGQFVIGTFTATMTTEAITASTTGFSTSISAFQIRNLGTVPEPSSYAAILGGLSLCFVCCRRRQKVR